MTEAACVFVVTGADKRFLKDFIAGPCRYTARLIDLRRQDDLAEAAWRNAWKLSEP
jgi:hypothetical protein